MRNHISLIASSIRPHLWGRFLKSLSQNSINIEVIFVGDKFSDESLLEYQPENITFHHIYSTVKPAQCYEIGFRAATGTLVGWTADEVVYSPQALDNQYQYHQNLSKGKLVTGMSCIENGHRTSNFHFIGDHTTPRMMVYGFIDRFYFRKLGGYDRRFITGQAENDICMRVLEDGGITSICNNALLTNSHEIDGIHTTDSKFRKWQPPSRKFLEECWFIKPNVTSKTRLIPFEPFKEESLLTVSQEPKGEW